VVVIIIESVVFAARFWCITTKRRRVGGTEAKDARMKGEDEGESGMTPPRSSARKLMFAIKGSRVMLGKIFLLKHLHVTRLSDGKCVSANAPARASRVFFFLRWRVWREGQKLASLRESQLGAYHVHPLSRYYRFPTSGFPLFSVQL
jgi:hypothetical protein